jgi:pimeloyl-ACP methyl ester carboxylesterase
MKDKKADKTLDTSSARKEKRKVWILLLPVLVCFVILVCIILPPSLGTVASFLNKDGKKLAGSISEKIFIEINGVEQGMFIKGMDTTKPVLLLVHGGPGMADYFLAKQFPTGIENEFVVCYWEQRGTGISYSADIAPQTMTTEQFVSDIIEVTNYLRNRFGQDKIYLMGHSWGTYLSIKTVAKSPELYHAYIAMSQVVNLPESEKLAYTYMLGQYTAAGKRSMVKKFKKYPIWESDKALLEYSRSSLRDEAMHDLGVGTMRNMHSVIRDIFFASLRCTEYTPMERINIWRGKIFSSKSGLRGELDAFDAATEAPALNIPVYFFAGRYDYTCCYSLQRKYYESLSAPVKGFYTFDESAHSPLFEEPEEAMNILYEDVLNGVVALQDEK